VLDSQPETGPLLTRSFRRFLGATVSSSIVNGTTRFGFVWAMGELTSWEPAIGLLGIMLGLPALLTAPLAGALADRFDRRHVAAAAAVAMAVTCAATGALLQVDLLNPATLGLLAFVVSVPVAAVVPPLQAMVPSLVEPERLMNGVAMQNLAMLASMAAGMLIAGVVIQTAGTAALFGLMFIVGLISAAQLAALPEVAGKVGEGDTSAARGWAAIREGLTYARRDPTILVLIGVVGVIGIGSAAAGLLIPAFADRVLGSGAVGAGAMNAAMAFGLIITAGVLASRAMVKRPGLLLAVVFAAIAGPGLIAIGLSRTLILALIACLVWGMGGGVVMTLQRTLIQQRSSAEVMGRMMGLSAMAQFGTFPLAALLVFAIVGPLGVANTIVAMGVAMFIGAAIMAWHLARLERAELSAERPRNPQPI